MAGNDPQSVGGICERAREWSSLRLDGELSVLEEELLERHLGACEPCRGFEAGMRSTTGVLRTTPAEIPSRPLTAPAGARGFSLERRRTAILAAAALALGALVGSLVERPGEPAPAAPPSQVSLLSRDADELRELPRTRLLTPAPVPVQPPNLPEGAV